MMAMATSAVASTPGSVKVRSMRVRSARTTIEVGRAHSVQNESVRFILSKRQVKSTHHDVYRVTHGGNVAYHDHCPMGQPHRQQL